MLWLSWWTVAAAETWTVGPGQELGPILELAAPGDVVEVSPGTYTGRYYLPNTQLEIVGVGGASETTLVSEADPEDTSPIFVLESSTITLRGLTLDGAGRGGALLAFDSSVTGEDLRFEGSRSLDLQRSTLTLRASALVGSADGPLSTVGYSQVTVEDTLISGGSGDYGGGGLFLDHTDAIFRRCTFEDNAASGDGGALQAFTQEDHETHIEDSDFRRNRTNGYGSAVSQEGGSLTVLRSTFRENVGNGAVNQAAGQRLHVEDCFFEDNQGVDSAGGVTAYNQVEATVLRSTFVGNTSEGDGAAIVIAGESQRAEIAGNRLCHNVSGNSGGAVALDSENGADLQTSAHHNVFVDNRSPGYGAALIVSRSTLELFHNTLVDSVSASNTGALWVGYQADATAWNNALVGNEGGAIVRDLYGENEITTRYNLLYDNPFQGSTGLRQDTTEVTAEPGFVDHVQGDCSSDLRPAPGSALIDAGDAGLDDDGSPADIGAYGGEGASTLLDLDGDGAIEDCAPYDPARVVPEEEIAADGIDQDCNGTEPCYVDADGDGVGTDVLAEAPDCASPGFAAAPGDCDDRDPERARCEEDLPPSWFCATSGGNPPWGLLAALMFAGRQRHQQR